MWFIVAEAIELIDCCLFILYSESVAWLIINYDFTILLSHDQLFDARSSSNNPIYFKHAKVDNIGLSGCGHIKFLEPRQVLNPIEDQIISPVGIHNISHSDISRRVRSTDFKCCLIKNCDFIIARVNKVDEISQLSPIIWISRE